MPKRSTKTLTAAAIQRAKTPSSGRVEYFDAITPGFALRVSEKGHKSFVQYYRYAGRNRRYTIGSFPVINLEKAREIARDVTTRAKRGEDPAAQKQVAQKDARKNSVAAIVDQFIERYAKPRNRSWRDTKGIFDRYVIPRWQHRPIKEITRQDVVELLDSVMDEGHPYMANRVLAAVKTLFKWCMERGVIEISPALVLKAPAIEKSRERTLDDVEIRSSWAIFKNDCYPFGSMFKLLLVTGQRRTEVAQMRWSYVDIETGIWTIPAAGTKAKRIHEVPLSDLALSILGEIPRLSGDYVFSTSDGHTPVSGYSKAKQRVEKRLNEVRQEEGLDPLPNWRLHDLRRTVATRMGDLDFTDEVIGLVLNHARKGVTAGYNKSKYRRPKQRALEAWARKLEGILGEAESNVVSLHA